jgi:hypothetical protein
MQRRTLRVPFRVALAAALLIAGGGTAVLAQGAPGAYEQLLAALVSLQRSVNAIQESVNAIGTVSNVAVTPMVQVGGDDVFCHWVNAASAPRTVEIQLFNAPFGTLIFEHPDPVPIDPGKRMGIGVPGHIGQVYCKFTVVDGTKADIRANLTVTPDGLGVVTHSLSVSAE